MRSVVLKEHLQHGSPNRFAVWWKVMFIISQKSVISNAWLNHSRASFHLKLRIDIIIIDTRLRLTREINIPCEPLSWTRNIILLVLVMKHTLTFDHRNVQWFSNILIKIICSVYLKLICILLVNMFATRSYIKGQPKNLEIFKP